MTGLLSPEEIERGLVAQGVPLERARAVARGGVIPPTARDARPVVEILAMPAIRWPFRLTIPWSLLVSDNQITATLINGHPQPVRTQKYRDAKSGVRKLAVAAMGQPKPEPANYPLSLEARVWVPDNRIHDTANLQKCAHDALESIVYTKDAWLYRVMWERVGTDVDAPRAEITILPLAT